MRICLSKIIVTVILVATSVFGTEIIFFGTYDKSEFSPAREQSFTIPFKLTENAQVSIDIYTPDGNKIRTLSSKKELGNGKHSLSWDGKDNAGIVIPDEAYTIVLKAKNKKGTSIVDPRSYSGGEIETNLQTKITLEGKTIYSLSKASRVLIRAGIKDGPMMRSLINWVPKPAGKNIQHWNGYDEDKVVNVLATKRYGVIVVAFALPEYSIITTGNSNLSYAQYYKNKGYKFKQTPKKERLIERDSKGISPHHYSFRITDKDPMINISFPKNVNKTKDGIALFKNNEAIPIKVTMPTEDEKMMEQSKYEVSFFIDFEFKSEEELGFMPITWLWSPNGLSKGKHILSVNISGFNGQVGVENIEFEIR
jgi:hypothetical protein